MRILIVDDSEDGREVAEAMLLVAGYQDVRAVASAAEAYRFLEIGGQTTQRPSAIDLILLDIMMPEIDGIVACARIRSEKRYTSVPIIMVTSLADSDSLANAFVAGATDYITKPVNRVELLARVRSALKLKAELDRREARERELLQQMPASGNRRGQNWIDEATGLFTGEVAETYLTHGGISPDNSDTSIIALAVDRLDALRSTQGEGVAAAIMASVAGVVRATSANVGVIAAAYRGEIIVLIGHEMKSDAAARLGEALREGIADMRLENREAMAASHVTASVTVVTGTAAAGIDRVRLLTRAMSALQKAVATGGDRVVPEIA